MDTTPLPTQDHDLSDYGSVFESELNHYVVRITPYGKFTYDELVTRIHSEPQITRYVIAKETVPQDHYHLVLSTDDTLEVQDVKDIISAFIRPFWEVDGKLPRGYGNKQYNLQVAEDIDKSISYAIKDTITYTFEGYTPEYIAQRKEESFKKKSTTNFKVEFQLLKEEFHNSQMDTRSFMTKFCLLKSKYDQLVNLSHAYQYSLSVLFRRDPNEAERFVENYLYKL